MPEMPGFEIPEEVLALHAEVAALRDALRADRTAVIDSLGTDATRDDIKAALEAWHDSPEVVVQRDELNALTKDLRDIVKENRPERPVIEVPEEIEAKRVDLEASREALAASREAVVAALGEDATDEDVRAAIDAWREENSVEIDAAKALAEEIRNWFRDNRPERPDRPFAPGKGMKDRFKDFKENANAMRDAHMQFREDLKNPDLTPEQRREIIQQFKQDQQELLNERKQLKRQGRDDGDSVGGGRRPGS
jgi:hypothetical protein